jgi:hypothetical protein
MLKLVESLASKAARAKRTTVEFMPLREGTFHHCAWCGQYAKGSPKGWHYYQALDYTYPGGLRVVGEVCANRECQMSVKAKYPKPE